MKNFLVKILTALFLAVLAAPLAVERADAAPGDFLFKWGTPHLLNHPDTIAVDGSGNIYLLQNSQVWVLDKKGTLLRSWGSYGTGHGQFVYPSGLAVAGDKVYVSDAGNDRIQEFDSNGNFIRTWGSQGTGPGMFSFPEGIATDKNGNVYIADSENARIQVFDGSGNFIRSFAGSGDVQLRYPRDLAVDGAGNIYVVDGVDILVFNNSGSFLRKWGAYGDGGDPSGIAIDSAGNIFVGVNPYTDFFPPEKVQVFDSNGNFIRQWGSFGFNDGQFFNLGGVALDPSGNVYVADTNNDRIEIFDNAGKFLAKIGGHDADGQFNTPFGVATDTAGYVHVGDQRNYRIQSFDGSGNFLRKFGSLGDGPGQFANIAALATDRLRHLYVADPGGGELGHGYSLIQVFDASGSFLKSWQVLPGQGTTKPTRLAVAASGNVYVSDGYNNRILVFDSSGNLVTTWGRFGTSDGLFSTPIGVAVDASDNVYVVDQGNSRIQVFSSSGVFLRKWGSNGTGDGQLSYPTDIAVDGSGRVYVTESDYNLKRARIQVFDATGKFVGKWGSYGTGDGQLYDPVGIAADPSGSRIYVVDATLNRVSAFKGFGDQLPAGWIGRDIGSVGVTGRASYANGIFTIQGSGANIWGTADAFHYVYQPLVGDGQIVARVTSVENTNGYAKGGVMIRESLAADSRQVMVDMTPGYGAEFSRRLTTGGATTVNANGGVGVPEWVKLVRQGSTFSAYISKDGVTWTSMGSATVSMASSVYVGLIANSHLNSVLCRTTLDNVAVTSQKQGPTVALTAPSDGASFSAPGNITLSASATAGTGATVKQIDFYSGATLIGSASAAPYTVTWSNVPAGSYSLTAKVTDSLGQTATSPAVSVTVSSSGLPAPWLSQDVGSVGVVGSAAYANGTFTLKGSGANIWGSSDAFRFVYQPMTGDAQIIARVATVQNTNAYAKAGVMIRNSLAANAIHATMDLTPTSGAEFLRRTSTGGTTSATLRSGLAAPYWVKLVRSGNTFTGSVSSDGANWVQTGTSTISMGSTVYVGLIVNSHNNTVLCSATVDHVTAGPTGSDTVAPTVTAFTLPVTYSSLTVPITTLTASDNFGVAGYLLTESSTKPSATASGWSSTAPGSYTFTGTGTKTLYAWAKDAAGNVSAGRSATVTVSAGALPAPWQTRDIGSVGVAGSATYSNGVFTLNGSGANIYGGADAFRYVYQSLTGDGEIVAKVAYLQNTNGYAKGGVMIRETLASNAAYAMMDLTPGYGGEFSFRPLTGATSTSSVPFPGIAAPYWVKLTRAGSTFTGSVSSDGVIWRQVGTQNISMAATVFVGLIVNSHNNTVLCTTTMDHVSLSSAVDKTAPTITAFSIPASSTSLTVAITTFTATDNVGVTGYLLTESSTPDADSWSSTPPASFTFASAGSKRLYAFVRDAASNISPSRSATTTVSGLPAPWQKQDIGSVGIPGSASYANGIYTLSGSGADIWGTADSFYFVYKTITGDGETRASIDSLACANTWAKGGVMMRQSLNAGSRHAMMDITPGAGAEFSRRLTTGGSTTVSSTAGIKVPYSVRLVRKGTTFTGYISFDEVNWVQAGSATINMTDTIYAGFLVNSHNNSALCTARIDSVR
jgi:DNA-binding beta-propeller fold protein YncE